jgi:predicted dehydrogenase
VTRPRLGFLGVGWIGRDRLDAIANAGTATIAAIADPVRERRDAALACAPHAISVEHFGQLLEIPLDGIVIATPSALHAEQAIAALSRGLAVFCQKPLARSAHETRQVVEAARTANRLLAVDLSYRHTTAIQKIRDIVHAGAIGRPFAVDLVFHNAYGPDAPWFYDKTASGGGCVMDLGIHLVDLALWLLGFPRVRAIASQLYASGEPLGPAGVEDFAAVQLALENNVVARLACSWRVSAGRDAVIELSMFGSKGGVTMRNVDGSFYDFVAAHHVGTGSRRIASPPDAWGGRAALAWVDRLASDARFDPAAERLIDVATVLDGIYEGAS